MFVLENKEKKKNKNHNINSKKINKKTFFIIIGIVFFLLVTSIIFFLISRKEKSVDDINVNELSYVQTLTEANEVEAAKLIKENIVKITNKIDDDTSIIGTGFFIKDGYLITNSHVVDIMGDITIEYYDGSTTGAYLYSNSVEYDVALLKVENVSAKALSFGNSNNLEITNDVLAAGYIYNFAGEATVSKGILSARRNVDTFAYLQSDISIDTGSSGGPLFNSNAEALGMNTYVTENRTFAFSISAESISMIVDVLLESPSIEYLTEDRPSNSINSILVEVGFTEDENYDLYNDSEIIEKSKNKYEKDLEEASQKDNVVTSNEEKNENDEYYCDNGYSLIGRQCVKQSSYFAEKNDESCKSGYTYSGNICTKVTTVSAKTKYSCTSDNLELNSDNKCIFEGYATDFGFTDELRYGSCPKGKNCYEYYAQNQGVSFVATATCPSGTTTISLSGVKYVWDGEEINSSNYKIFNKRLVYGILKSVDSNGLTYYANSTGLSMAINCAKTSTTDSDGNKIYTFLTYDELKNTACEEGTLTASKNSDGTQGFYCKLSVNPSVFVYDVVCNDDDAEVWQEKTGSQIFCRKWVNREYNSVSEEYCDSGYYLNGDTCTKSEQYALLYTYSCNNGDTLSGTQCLTTEIINAKKK